MIDRWFDTAGDKKSGGTPPPGYTVMMLAKEYHCLPQDIEQMDTYWYDRMVALMQAESRYSNRQIREQERNRRRPRMR